MSVHKINNTTNQTEGDVYMITDRFNPVVQNVTSLLSNTPSYHPKFANGQFGTYVIYEINYSGVFVIDKTLNSGVSWQYMSQNNKTHPFLPIFEVSDINENIMYLEGGNNSPANQLSRRIIKSFDGGNTFTVQYPYNGIGGGIYVHPDVRSIHMVNRSIDGLSDEFFVGNDGGILYSNSSNSSTLQINWQNKNGVGLAVTQFFGMGQTQLNDDIYAGGAQDNGISVNRFNNWNVSIVGDGYEAFFMRNTPNISFYQAGSNGTLSRYHRNTTALTKSIIVMMKPLAVLKNYRVR